jgi:hypothetical protein
VEGVGEMFAERLFDESFCMENKLVGKVEDYRKD